MLTSESLLPDPATGAQPDAVASTAADSILAAGDDEATAVPDEELLRRILNGKRASEGAIRFGALRGAALLATERRKSSLIPADDQLLPPVTEGVMMDDAGSGTAATSSGRKSLSQNPNLSDSCSSSGSLRSLATRGAGAYRRNSTANDTSVSSSSSHRSSSGSSADGGAGGAATSVSSISLSESGRGGCTRSRSRCSSIISQCSVTSSVLSESARQQLNFTLSPDLPLDCIDLYEANAQHRRQSSQFGSGSIGRPASPEPTSMLDDASDDNSAGSGQWQLRPESRLSLDATGLACDDENTEDARALLEAPVIGSQSPDSTLGDDSSDETSGDARLRNHKQFIKRRLMSNINRQ